MSRCDWRGSPAGSQPFRGGSAAWEDSKYDSRHVLALITSSKHQDTAALESENLKVQVWASLFGPSAFRTHDQNLQMNPGGIISRSPGVGFSCSSPVT